MQLYIESIDCLSALAYLDRVGMSLFLKLLAGCDKDSNRVKVDYDDLLDFFSHFAKPGVIKRSTLVRHLKILRRNGLVSIVPGKRNDFLLNPVIVYHGITSGINDCEFYYEYPDGLMLTGEFINHFLPDNTVRDKPSVENPDDRSTAVECDFETGESHE